MDHSLRGGLDEVQFPAAPPCEFDVVEPSSLDAEPRDLGPEPDERLAMLTLDVCEGALEQLSDLLAGRLGSTTHGRRRRYALRPATPTSGHWRS